MKASIRKYSGPILSLALAFLTNSCGKGEVSITVLHLSEGEIYIDGKNVREMKVRSLSDSSLLDLSLEKSEGQELMIETLDGDTNRVYSSLLDISLEKSGEHELMIVTSKGDTNRANFTGPENYFLVDLRTGKIHF
ncbi:hypothetical protein ACFL6Q_05305 [Candidatus Neomarinimicrobiota bacterium]